MKLRKIVSLQMNTNLKIMATYTITLNERTTSGKALIEYLNALGILIHKVSAKEKSSYLNYFNSAKNLIVLTIWLVYEFSLSYQETTCT